MREMWQRVFVSFDSVEIPVSVCPGKRLDEHLLELGCFAK
jgi:hypothetical protein